MPDETLDRRGRYLAGKALRRAVSRESLAAHDPAPRDPIAILGESDAARLQNLVPIRYERMLQSPFTFLRGAAAVMANDLSSAPKVGIPVQACGDAHLMNYGAFSTPENRVLFDINDFDETLPGVDFTADIKRLAASVAVAALAAGWSGKKAQDCAEASACAYRTHMLSLAKLSPLEAWHSAIDLTEGAVAVTDQRLAAKLRDLVARAHTSLDRDDNFPHIAGGAPAADWQHWTIIDKPPTIYHLPSDSPVRFDTSSAFAAYRTTLTPERIALLSRYTLVDHAMKVVGVGSVGTFCAIGLFSSGDGEPLFLQVKEADTSALERIAGVTPWADEPGRRVVEGQRMMQASSDIFLGWCRDEASGRHFYVRQLKNRRLGSIGELMETAALADYAKLCGRTLARAHARSADAATLAGYMGKSAAFDKALGAFSMLYADQTRRDHAALVAAKGKSASATPVHTAA
jgi:uncharacterized protein (DUF2252 family)